MSDPQWWLLDDLVLARATIDRAAARRSDDSWVQAALDGGDARFVHVHAGTALITGSTLAGTAHRPGGVPVTLLGVDHAGVAYFCVHHVEPSTAPSLGHAGAVWMGPLTSREPIQR
jgi:hypothetical protein